MAAHTHTLWPFNALAKLKLTANVTFYDCVCISTDPWVCASVFEDTWAASAPRNTLYLAPHLVSIMQMSRSFQFQFVCLWIAIAANTN